MNAYINPVIDDLNSYPGQEFGGAIMGELDFDPSSDMDVETDYATYPDIFSGGVGYDFVLVPDAETITADGFVLTAAQKQEVEARQTVEKFSVLGAAPLFPPEPDPVSVLQIFNQYNGNYYTTVDTEPQKAQPETVNETEKPAVKLPAFDGKLLVYALMAVVIILIIKRL
jgi:hypothetical protein